jgi:DNA-binding response OmpR family regulator
MMQMIRGSLSNPEAPWQGVLRAEMLEQKGMRMPKKILIIDDEKDLVNGLSFRLAANHYSVMKTYNGPEGLKAAETGSPNLILLDVSMPGMDGFEVLRRLKNNPKTQYIPVIMLTGRRESKYFFKAEELGSADYIIKPFEDAEFLSVIKKHA